MKVLVTGANGQLGTDLCRVLEEVIPLTSDQYPQKARRPSFLVLDNYHLRLLGMGEMRTGQEALKDYLREKGHIR
jgi:dTDP-4-dehydrorhamnose reductase